MAENLELGEGDVGRDLHRVEAVVPLVANITHGVTDWKERECRLGIAQNDRGTPRSAPGRPAPSTHNSRFLCSRAACPWESTAGPSDTRPLWLTWKRRISRDNITRRPPVHTLGKLASVRVCVSRKRFLLLFLCVSKGYGGYKVGPPMVRGIWVLVHTTKVKNTLHDVLHYILYTNTGMHNSKARCGDRERVA